MSTLVPSLQRNVVRYILIESTGISSECEVKQNAVFVVFTLAYTSSCLYIKVQTYSGDGQKNGDSNTYSADA